MSLRILLLQARHADDPVAGEELAQFAAKAGSADASFEAHDLLFGPPDLETARSYDALTIGGSGDFYVSKGDLPYFDAFLDFLRRVVDEGLPMFASCFGFQCLVTALGGDIVHHPERTEVGTYPVTLTDAGHGDPILGSMPATFAAQLGRKDRADRLPDGTVNLARSEVCMSQALRVDSKPIWATQFHPELNCSENRGRYMRYLEGYGPALNDDHETVLERFKDSPEAETLIARFITVVFGDNHT